jgi:hypothetical protein
MLRKYPYKKAHNHQIYHCSQLAFDDDAKYRAVHAVLYIAVKRKQKDAGGRAKSYLGVACV